MAIQSYNDPITVQWNTDANGNKISVPIYDESHIVANLHITLNQIPDQFNRVEINGLYEIQSGVPDNTQFRVDYSTGVISFDSSHEGQIITIKQYAGRGIARHPATRVYDILTGNEIDTQKTLQDYVNSVKEIKYEDAFDETQVYMPNKIVYYNGTTYICISPTYNHELPINTTCWKPLALGSCYKGEYDDALTYHLQDIVKYDLEKATYICIKPTTQGIKPTNTEYWEKVFSVKEITDYASQQGDYAKDQGDYAQTKADTLNDTINQFDYIGDYDDNVNYLPKNMVKYHGSTYVNKIACKGIVPTNTTNWQVIATGFVFKGDYDSNKTYEERDIVYYGIEKTLYICSQHAGIGTSPYNTDYWQPMLNAETMIQQINDYVNDTTSLYVAHDMGVTINHDLNDYPMPLVVALNGNSYGHGGFGTFSYGGGSIYQVISKAEYIDMNNLKLYFNEYFDGVPTITKINITEYQIDFSNDNSVKVKLK